MASSSWSPSSILKIRNWYQNLGIKGFERRNIRYDLLNENETLEEARKLKRGV